MSNAPNEWPCPPRSPSRRTAPSPGRVEGPNAICYSARSRSWPLRSFGTSCGVDRSVVLRPRRLPAEIDLALGMGEDGKTSAAQHGFDAGAVRCPPVGGVIGIFVLDEMHLGIARTVEMVCGPKIIVLRDGVHPSVTSQHRLKQQLIADDVLTDQIEREQRMAEVIKHAHEDHEIELLAQFADVVSRQLAKFD